MYFFNLYHRYFSQNLLIDNNRDFVTLEDEQGQQRLREQAEQRRKGWDIKPFMAFHYLVILLWLQCVW